MAFNPEDIIFDEPDVKKKNGSFNVEDIVFDEKEMISDRVYVEKTGEVVKLPSGGINRLIAISRESYKKGDASTEISQLQFQELIGYKNPSISSRIQELNKKAGREIKTKGLEDILRASAEQIPNIREMFEKGITRGLQTSLVTGIGAAVIAPPTAPIATAAGFGAGFTMGSIESAFILESGSSFGEIREFKSKDGVKINEDVARLGAVMAGSVSAGLEVLSFSILVKVFPGGKQLLSKMGGKAGKVLKLPTTKKALKDFLLNLSKVVSAETVTEGLQEVSAISGGEFAKFVDEREFEKIATKKAIERIIDSGIEGAKASLGLGGVGSTARLVSDVSKVDRSVKKTFARSINLEGETVDAVVEKSDKKKGKFTATFFRKDGTEAGDVTMNTFEEAEAEARRVTGVLKGGQETFNVKAKDVTTKADIEGITPVQKKVGAGEFKETTNEQAKLPGVKAKRKTKLGSFIDTQLQKEIKKSKDKKDALDIAESELKSLKDVRDSEKEADAFVSGLRKEIVGEVKESKIKKSGIVGEEKLLPKTLLSEEGSTLDDIASRENISEALSVLGYDADSNGLRQFIRDEIGEQSADGRRLIRAEKIAKSSEVLGLIKEKEFQIKELKPKLIAKRETTILKEKIASIKRGFRKGVVETKKTLDERIKAVNDIISTLSLKDKGKFVKTIGKVTQGRVSNIEKFNNLLSEIQKRVDGLVEQAERNQLFGKISKNIKKSKPVIPSGKKVGKFVARIQDILDPLIAISKMTKDQASEELAKNLEKESNINALENLMLNVMSNPQGIDISELNILNEEIDAIVNFGETLKKSEVVEQKEKVDEIKKEFKELMGQRDQTKPLNVQKVEEAVKHILGGFISWNGAWWNKMKVIIRSSDKARVNKLIDKIILFENARAFEISKNAVLKEFEKIALKATGIKNSRQLINKLHKDDATKIDLGVFEFSDGKRRRLILTKAQLRKRWMELQDSDLRELITNKKSNAYTEEIIQTIENNLDEQDLRLAKAQLEFYEKYYSRINKVYRKIYGVSLPKLEFYSPIKREFSGKETDEFLSGILYRGGVVPGSFKSRKRSVRPLENLSDIQVLGSHIMEMEYFITYKEKLQELDSVFKSPDMQSSIKQEWGKRMLDTINADLDYFSKRNKKIASGYERILVSLNRNFGFSQIAMKPQVGLKQIVSFSAFNDGVKTKNFIEGLAQFVINPKEMKRLLSQSTLLKHRGTNLDNDFQEIFSDKSVLNVLRKFPGISKMLMITTLLGDKAAIVLGGAHIYAKIKEGSSEAVAIKSFELKAARTQQSSDIDQLSEPQRSSAFDRILTQFMSSPNALMRAEFDSLNDLLRRRKTRKEFMKDFINLHILIPMMYQFVANGFQWDDDDQLRASILGGLNGIFIIGDIFEAVISKVLTGDYFNLELRHPTSFVNAFLKASEDFALDDVTLEDFLEGESYIDQSLKGMSGVTGFPLRTMYHELRGTAKVSEGVVDGNDNNLKEGGFLMLGYSPWTVEEKILK